MRLRFILGEVVNGLRRNGTMALSVVLVTFVSLMFVGAAALTQMQIDQLKDDWYGKVEISIFLCPENSTNEQCAEGAATPEQEAAIRAVLEEGALSDLVDTVYYESREEAYDKFVANDSEGIWSSLTPDQMQPSFRVKLADPEQFEVVADATEGLPGVDVVRDQREIFSELFRFLNAATVVAAALAGVMLIAAMLLITTTIRLSALSRRRETQIMRMVGSSRSLIQMPFMLEGAVAATGGALLAVGGLYFGVTYLVEDWLKGSVTWVRYIGTADVWTVAPWLLVVAVGLAAVASVVTLGRYTRA
ncbi:permease-like cell division protein FtsX [Demequina lignilytica]|uniref:Cell division protein FtsX n=1 Tax=Demequina lignilytica TaxID=3051663 RepID=A0AAW7MA90_9MICO|nr:MULTISPECIES: permease-like cell division protein FtsX [unclassified Demequina]MDN4478906.1 permease-like cell division protein FtsX [Demequina sp. SYSU T00039-1]MDN4483047.1 permease-like cell division protein FtsX [Demequina sp. SYSU T0a273]MDN4488781.1 permease-like cell division protein FtsX [Demequina sp. SYSU T00039]MDN4491835.1 permease-like cell division protein FtsX [Demequina sp. SYSU T00068]